MTTRKGAMKRIVSFFSSYWVPIAAIFMLGMNWSGMKASVSKIENSFARSDSSNNVAHDVTNRKIDSLTCQVKNLDDRVGLLSERVAKIEGQFSGIKMLLGRKITMFQDQSNNMARRFDVVNIF
jgi:hypothetical protein